MICPQCHQITDRPAVRYCPRCGACLEGVHQLRSDTVDEEALAAWEIEHAAKTARRRAERFGMGVGVGGGAILLAIINWLIVPVGLMPFARLPRSSFALLCELTGTVLVVTFCIVAAKGGPATFREFSLSMAKYDSSSPRAGFTYGRWQGFFTSLIYVLAAICMGLGR